MSENELTADGDEKLTRHLRDLERSIEKAIAGSPLVEECLARVRAEGYEVSLVLEATLALAPRGQVGQPQVEELNGILAGSESRFKMSSHDKKFLRSLKIAVDDDGSGTP